jgi:Zn-finger protein
MENYKFVQNKACEYFPCHAGVDCEKFSCLFCYCPLYALGEACGGNFTMTEHGIKDCSTCAIPHQRENYGSILAQYPRILELIGANAPKAEEHISKRKI